MLFLLNFTSTIVEKLNKDYEGDHRVCDCPKPGGTQCHHAIVDLYANNLKQTAMLQSELVALLDFLMTSGGEEVYQYLQGRLHVFLARNPNTLLENVLRTLGRAGVVTVGNGAPIGQGAGVVFDGHVPSGEDRGGIVDGSLSDPFIPNDDSDDLDSEYYDLKELEGID